MLTKLRDDFLNPKDVYSPIPFWFWNDDLSKEEIKRQILEFLSKGVNGFIIHPRIGLPSSLEYLSDEFMEYVKYAVDVAAEHRMTVILYDEAMYPSGSCHGKVVEANPNYASKGLRMSTSFDLEEGEEFVASVDYCEALGTARVVVSNLDENYYNNTSVIIEAMEKVSRNEGDTRYYFFMTDSNGTIRGIHFGEDDNEKNAPKSSDLLNKDAVTTFIKLTHERYYNYLSEYFSTTITGIFTDEPMILGRCHKEYILEWTHGFLNYYIEHGGKVEDLPSLFLSEGEAFKKFKEIVNQRLLESYYIPIHTWCTEHKINFIGHPEQSDDIGLLSSFDIPCQDIVWRFISPEGEKGITGVHSTMGKCSSDSARHHGKARNGNECFGCCGAADDPFLFTRDDMKWYLDWLFVRGVNFIIPHAFFYSIREERVNERPPDVGMNSTFWGEYKEITDYIKRMSELLTGCVNQTNIAVLCNRDRLSDTIVKPLFENQVEFNYLEEELLRSCDIDNGILSIKEQSYRLLITDGDLSNKSLKVLNEYEISGGSVLYVKDYIRLISELKELINEHKELELPYQTDNYEPKLRTTMIKKFDTYILILSNEGEDEIHTRLEFNGYNIIERWNPQDGTIEPMVEATPFYQLSLHRRTISILILEKIVL